MRDKQQLRSEVRSLTAAERAEILDGWNDTVKDYPDNVCIHKLIEMQVEVSPDAQAVAFEGESLSYSSLNTQANKLAHHLRTLGIGPDLLVAVHMERSLELVVALFAIFKAGGAYLPLDPSYPEERLKFMVEDADPLIILTHEETKSALDAILERAARSKVLDINTDAIRWAAQSAKNPEPNDVGLMPEHLAYVIYTSGSTGVPKGVMIEHRGLVNRLEWMQASFKLSAQDAVLQKTPFGFDVSVWEFFWPLIAGSKLVIAPPHDHKAIDKLATLIKREKVTTLHFVPPMLALFLEHENISKFSSLTRVICSGEALTISQMKHFKELAPNLSLYNLYGPTEATIDVSAWNCCEEDLPDTALTVPIGRPIWNTRLYILDGNLAPVVSGVSGEIYIGGVGVARGYLNQPELTGERFIESPFVQGDRLYRTGDIGRYFPDGNIEYLGRNDFQVKIRGVRIELGEIEARLTEHPLIRESIVMARTGGYDEKQLVAYYTLHEHAQLDTHSIRNYLSSFLAEEMTPAAYVCLGAFPLTANGKVDRKALRPPNEQDLATQAYEAPKGTVEETIAQVWEEVLELKRVGRNDNFFNLGGDSFRAVRIHFKLCRRLGYEIASDTLFAHPTISALSKRLSVIPSEKISPTVVPSLPYTGRIPLSHSQKGLWFLSQLDETDIAYLIPTMVRLKGLLCHKALESALHQLVRRHQALRTIFENGEGEGFQKILPEEQGVGFEICDIQHMAAPETHLKELKVREVRKPMNIHQGPLIRTTLVKLSQSDSVLFLTVHHIVSDEWSQSILVRELSELYNACIENRKASLEALPIQYSDYTLWQRQLLSGSKLDQLKKYWLSALAGAPELLNLPTDFRRSAKRISAGDSVKIELDEDLTHALRELSQRYELTLFMVMLSGWALVLSRLSGQDDLVIGVPYANRSNEAVEGLIGLFVNTLAIRLDLSDTVTVEDVLMQIKYACLGAYTNQDFPLANLIELGRRSRGSNTSPIVQVMFAWQDDEPLDFTFQDVEVENLTVPFVASKFDLSLNLNDFGQFIQGRLEFSTALYTKKTVKRIERYLISALREIVRAPKQLRSEVRLLTAAERAEILDGWNDTVRDYPDNVCIHKLIEMQVEVSPDAQAVAFEGESLSYSSLNTQANKLAHHLRTLGIGPDLLVAVHMERSLELVVALFAIFKAGGAYLPLDPSYPEERLKFMVEDADPLIILTHEETKSALDAILERAARSKVLDINTDAIRWAAQSAKNPEPNDVGLMPEHLAYVIYTSGSTGVPKGVMIEHRGLVNRLEWMQASFKLSAQDAVLQKTPFGFDVSVWEFFWPLIAGSKLVIAPPHDHKAIDKLATLIKREKVTTLHFVPPMLALFLEHENISKFSSLTRVICSGEALTISQMKHFKELAPNLSLYNLYGPTEATIDVSAWNCCEEDLPDTALTVPIGRPIWNTRLYILDGNLAPVVSGVSGEIYIGGVGVARGYLNQPELTGERFIESPFVQGDRLYRTGDIGRYFPDGNIEYLGRNDFQVKIRGVRIELGEIEARLTEHPLIRESIVMARTGGYDEKQLVAYYTLHEHAQLDTHSIRNYLSSFLAEEMTPAAYVCLGAFPLTANGKVDRKALRPPNEQDLATQAYEAPKGTVEETIAQVWEEVLELKRVGRNDNFFNLGGDSFRAVRVSALLCERGIKCSVRQIFEAPNLAAITQDKQAGLNVEVPDYIIETDCQKITPAMLPLTKLNQTQIDTIVASVPGGISNVKDIYSLTALQEGILFHHLIAEHGDPYILSYIFSFDNRQCLDTFIAALKNIVKRHDVLRTSMHWNKIIDPVQVVWRHAPFNAEEIEFDPTLGSAVDQLKEMYYFPLDLGTAPVMQLVIGLDMIDGQWVALWRIHHCVVDHISFDIIRSEISSYFLRQEYALPTPLPFRNHVAVVRAEQNSAQARIFFQQLLGDVVDPTAPFGLLKEEGTGQSVSKARLDIGEDLSHNILLQAKSLGVGTASLFHVAWALVIGCLSGKQDPVFGTVLFGRTRSGSESSQALGLFINTLPVRSRLRDVSVRKCIIEMHNHLAELMQYENTSLAVAHRCSKVLPHLPLFTSILNYRYSDGNIDTPSILSHAWGLGVEEIECHEQSNYPLNLTIHKSVGTCFALTALTNSSVDPNWICELKIKVLGELVEMLERAPDTSVWDLALSHSEGIEISG